MSKRKSWSKNPNLQSDFDYLEQLSRPPLSDNVSRLIAHLIFILECTLYQMSNRKSWSRNPKVQLDFDYLERLSRPPLSEYVFWLIACLIFIVECMLNEMSKGNHVQGIKICNRILIISSGYPVRHYQLMFPGS